MRTNYAFVSFLILLVLSPLAGMAQEMPNQRTLTRMQKMQSVVNIARGNGHAFVKINTNTSASATAAETQQLKRDLLRMWDGSEWIDNEETNYLYNGSDPVSEVVRSWNGFEWTPTHRVTYQRNEDQKISTILHENFAGNGEYEPAERYLLTYGYHFQTNDLILAHAVYEVLIDSEWTKVSRDRFLYTVVDFELYPGGWVESDWDGEAWEDVHKSEMTVTGSDIIQTDYMWSGSWIPMTRTVYMNTSMAEYEQIASKIEEQARVYVSLPLMMVELPDFYEQVWDGQIWIFDTRTERHVTTDWNTGHILKVEIEILEWDHHLWNSQMSFVIDYDSNEKPYRAGLDFPEDDEVTPDEPFRFTEDVFEYNDRGLLQSAELRMNYGTELINIFRHEFEWAGTGTDIDEKNEYPSSFNLGNGYPNPFNPATVIPYETGVAGHVTIQVYDILGRMVATLHNGPQSAGNHQVRFDASGLTSGKYLIRMQAPGYSQTRAVTLLK